jgi:tetratricopeptide (TPR) repeat protein
MRPAFAAIALFVLLVGSARADESTTAQARALYDKAIAHYDLAEYETAITEFKQAYELTREPALLFNIAQAHRLHRDYEQALHFYKTYLELLPDAPNRADAQVQIRKMKEALKAAHPPAAAPPVASPPVAPAPVPPAPAVASPPPLVAAAPPAPRPTPFARTRRGQATIALAVVGGAALIAAAGTGGEALSIRSRYDSGCASGPCDGSLYSRGRAYAIATDVLVSVGVVAAVTATLVALVHKRERPVTLGMRF